MSFKKFEKIFMCSSHRFCSDKLKKAMSYLAAAGVIFLVAVLDVSASNVSTCDYSGTQTQMNECAVQEFTRADIALNKAYKELMGSLNASDKTRLLAEQRAWLKTRDPSCRIEANNEAEGGSMWPMIFNSCRATATESRTAKLYKWQ